MAQSTGPILAIGAITVANRVLLNGQQMEWRIPVATGIAALLFGLVEKAAPRPVTALAWLALATVVLSRTDPGVPSPVESLNTWWTNSGRKA